MEKKELRIDSLTIQWSQTETERLCEQERFELAEQAFHHIRRLEMQHPLLLPQETEWDDEKVFCRYRLPQRQMQLQDCFTLSEVEKLKLIVRCLDFRELLPYSIVFSLDPANLVFDAVGRPYLAYRCLPEWLFQGGMDERTLLRQLQCFIFSLFNVEHFALLNEGALEIVIVTQPFLQKVRECSNLAMLEQLVIEQLMTLQQVQATKTVRITLKDARFMRRAAVIGGLVSAITSVALCYELLTKDVAQQKFLRADTAYVAENYPKVIEELAPLAIEDLPALPKFALATAYVYQHNFNNEQRKKALNGIQLNEQTLYSDYWIRIGRGQFDDALDLAKRLEDRELILHTLSQQIEAVRNSQTLSGSEREELLKKIRAEFEQYQNVRSVWQEDDSEEQLVRDRSSRGG